MLRKFADYKGSIIQTVEAGLEKLRSKTKSKSRILKEHVAKMEKTLEGKLSQDRLDEHKQTMQNFVSAVSNDVSSFNRVIHSLEDKVADMNKRLVPPAFLTQA